VNAFDLTKSSPIEAFGPSAGRSPLPWIDGRSTSLSPVTLDLIDSSSCSATTSLWRSPISAFSARIFSTFAAESPSIDLTLDMSLSGPASSKIFAS
jgi:hypothetical protein